MDSKRSFRCQCMWCKHMFDAKSGNTRCCNDPRCIDKNVRQKLEQYTERNRQQAKRLSSPYKDVMQITKYCPCGCGRLMRGNKYRAPGCQDLHNYIDSHLGGR